MDNNIQVSTCDQFRRLIFAYRVAEHVGTVTNRAVKKYNEDIGIVAC